MVPASQTLAQPLPHYIPDHGVNYSQGTPPQPPPRHPMDHNSYNRTHDYSSHQESTPPRFVWVPVDEANHRAGLSYPPEHLIQPRAHYVMDQSPTPQPQMFGYPSAASAPQSPYRPPPAARPQQSPAEAPLYQARVSASQAPPLPALHRVGYGNYPKDAIARKAKPLPGIPEEPSEEGSRVRILQRPATAPAYRPTSSGPRRGRSAAPQNTSNPSPSGQSALTKHVMKQAAPQPLPLSPPPTKHHPGPLSDRLNPQAAKIAYRVTNDIEGVGAHSTANHRAAVSATMITGSNTCMLSACSLASGVPFAVLVRALNWFYDLLGKVLEDHPDFQQAISGDGSIALGVCNEPDGRRVTATDGGDSSELCAIPYILDNTILSVFCKLGASQLINSVTQYGTGRADMGVLTSAPGVAPPSLATIASKSDPSKNHLHIYHQAAAGHYVTNLPLSRDPTGSHYEHLFTQPAINDIVSSVSTATHTAMRLMPLFCQAFPTTKPEQLLDAVLDAAKTIDNPESSASTQPLEKHMIVRALYSNMVSYAAALSNASLLGFSGSNNPVVMSAIAFFTPLLRHAFGRANSSEPLPYLDLSCTASDSTDMSELAKIAPEVFHDMTHQRNSWSHQHSSDSCHAAPPSGATALGAGPFDFTGAHSSDDEPDPDFEIVLGSRTLTPSVAKVFAAGATRSAAALKPTTTATKRATATTATAAIAAKPGPDKATTIVTAATKAAAPATVAKVAADNADYSKAIADYNAAATAAAAVVAATATKVAADKAAAKKRTSDNALAAAARTAAISKAAADKVIADAAAEAAAATEAAAAKAASDKVIADATAAAATEAAAVKAASDRAVADAAATKLASDKAAKQRASDNATAAAKAAAAIKAVSDKAFADAAIVAATAATVAAAVAITAAAEVPTAKVTVTKASAAKTAKTTVLATTAQTANTAVKTASPRQPRASPLAASPRTKMPAPVPDSNGFVEQHIRGKRILQGTTVPTEAVARPLDIEAPPSTSRRGRSANIHAQPK